MNSMLILLHIEYNHLYSLTQRIFFYRFIGLYMILIQESTRSQHVGQKRKLTENIILRRFFAAMNRQK